MSFSEDDDPLWKRILLNEMVLAGIAIAIILAIAFYLATDKGDVDQYGNPIPAKVAPK